MRMMLRTTSFKMAAAIAVLAFMSGCSGLNHSSRDYNTVIEGTLMAIHPFTGHGGVDAIETAPEGMAWAGSVVGFHIDRVLMGEVEPVRRGGPSQMDQMKEAVQNKDALNLLTLNFKDPDELIPKEWFQVAVIDPEKTFGVSTVDTAHKKRFKLYLQQRRDDPKSYIFIREKPLS